MKSRKSYLTINSIFSCISGLTLLMFSGRLGTLMNITEVFILQLIGANLLVFAAFVLFVQQKQATNKVLVYLISILDWLWVLGSGVIVILRLFSLSMTGYLLISSVALFVAYLAFHQVKKFNL